jgi:hypothetical protein
VNIEERVDETAFAMLGLTPEQRQQVLQDAFDMTLAKHPDMTEIPPVVVAYVAAVLRRIAELEQLPMGRA